MAICARNLTCEPPADGWHDTGDIVTIDAQGFITIKGRAKRFAKIAGEMISFAAVEALASELWPDALSAVAAVPDARKGERLIMVTQKKDPTRSEFQAFARSRGATEIMVPAEIIYMEKMPMLGTGKIDNMASEVGQGACRRDARGGRAGIPIQFAPLRSSDANFGTKPHWRLPRCRSIANVAPRPHGGIRTSTPSRHRPSSSKPSIPIRRKRTRCPTRQRSRSSAPAT
jgi:hypothetical protein